TTSSPTRRSAPCSCASRRPRRRRRRRPRALRELDLGQRRGAVAALPRRAGQRYAYWGTLFFSPGSAAIGPRPGELTAYVRVGATRGSLRVHRLAAGGITLAGDRSLDLENPADRAAYDAALRAGRRAAVEHCRLLAYRRDPGGCWQPGLGREAALYLPTMTTEEWYEGVTATMLAESPFRRSDYFKRFASGTLTKAQVWGHIAQHYLLIA